MRRKKNAARNFLPRSEHLATILSTNFSEESFNKRNRVEGPVKDLEECFFTSMRDRVEELVKQTKTQDKTNELKNKLLNVKTIPAAIITNAAQLAKCDRKVMCSHMEHRPGLKNVEEWKKFVSQNFDKIAEAAVGSVVKDTAKVYSSSTPTNKQPYEEMRTCTVQINSLFRSDLPPIVKTFVCTRLQDSMVTSTDYTLCFSAFVNMMISELKTSEFFFDNNDIKIKKVLGFNLAKLLPFVTTNEPKHTIQPLGKDLIASKRFETDSKCLFTSQHLQVVYSYFFGARGAKEENLNAHPVQNSLFCSFKEFGLDKQSFYLEKASSSAMSMALEMYLVNFENMWDGKKIINKLLDKVILVLLRHHLARNRESKRISTTTTRNPPGKKDIRNHVRYVCRAEDKKLKKLVQRKGKASGLEGEKWATKINSAKQRLANLRHTFKKKISQMLNDRKEASVKHKLVVQDLNIAEEQQDFLEEVGTLDDDVPERRLNQLKSVIKHLVFSNDTPVYLEDSLPPKKQYHVIAYQMYFCIFANDVLKYARYIKFTRALCPSTSFSSLSVLHLDSVALYQLLTQNIDQDKSEEPPSHTNQQEKEGYSRMILYGYNRDELIGSQDKARQNKDATFNAVFDMGEIQKACESYGLYFAHRMTCLPGMKAVRLLGSKIKTHGTVKEGTKQSYEARILRNPSIMQEGRKTKDALFSELQSLTEEVKTLESVRKRELDLLKDSNFQRKIKECKSNWGTTDDKDQLYRTIEKYKESRYKSYLMLYFRQMAIRSKSKLHNVKDVPQDSRSPIEKCGKGVTKAEDRTVVNPGDFNYAGTDNGLVNMTTSIPMSLQRMKFHLKLFNYYTALRKVSNEDSIGLNLSKEESFLHLPSVTNTKASDVRGFHYLLGFGKRVFK
ncbi:hypothetical protein J3Q64DRAFT_1883374 [Phycomyces blakesleeanus]|uniref:Uncharacterized protein n=1 Tax=Phycomyces blakesleeanus TaxID=4837 RepID=A0ABR3B2I6_PHYBL